MGIYNKPTTKAQGKKGRRKQKLLWQEKVAGMAENGVPTATTGLLCTPPYCIQKRLKIPCNVGIYKKPTTRAQGKKGRRSQKLSWQEKVAGMAGNDVPTATTGLLCTPPCCVHNTPLSPTSGIKG